MTFPFMDPDMIFRIPALLLALTVHEFAHAWTSHRLGDPTPKQQGRLTLNPLAHVDPIGLLMLWIFRFGWGRPVEVDPRYYNNRRRGTFLVSIAGPLSNIILAFIILLLSLVLPSQWSKFISIAFWFNIFIAVFNMLPIPPLDGSKILSSILSPKLAHDYQKSLGAYGFFIVFGLIAFGGSRIILVPIANFIANGMFALLEVMTRIF